MSVISLTRVDAWTILEGNFEGQTHVDIPLDPSYSLWSHPIGLIINLIVLIGRYSLHNKINRRMAKISGSSFLPRYFWKK